MEGDIVRITGKVGIMESLMIRFKNRVINIVRILLRFIVRGGVIRDGVI